MDCKHRNIYHISRRFHINLEVAQNVIEQMNGKAILADEVGLGKTIEAGLILKEYMIRGLVKKVLILVPASLVSQWAYELNTNFLFLRSLKGKVILGNKLMSSFHQSILRNVHRIAISF